MMRLHVNWKFDMIVDASGKRVELLILGSAFIDTAAPVPELIHTCR